MKDNCIPYGNLSYLSFVKTSHYRISIQNLFSQIYMRRAQSIKHCKVDKQNAATLFGCGMLGHGAKLDGTLYPWFSVAYVLGPTSFQDLALADQRDYPSLRSVA